MSEPIELTIADQQASELSWIAKSAYKEGLERGWFERHTDVNNQKRVSPSVPPSDHIEQEWLQSEARAALFQSAPAHEVRAENQAAKPKSSSLPQ